MLENLLSHANDCYYQAVINQGFINTNRKRVMANPVCLEDSIENLPNNQIRVISDSVIYEGENSPLICLGKITGKGRTYQGQCLNCQAEGIGEERSDDGKKLYWGRFAEGLYHGEGTLLEHSQNIKYVGNFFNGHFHGEGELFDYNAEIILKGRFEYNDFVEGEIRSLIKPFLSTRFQRIDM